MTSPYLPGTHKQFAWDSTSLGWLKTCPRLYYYSKLRNLTTKSKSPHLDFGIWYHKALENYDHLRAKGNDHESALRTVTEYVLFVTWHDGKPWESEHNLKNRFNLLRTVIWYLEEYQHDNATTVTLEDGRAAVEFSFALPVDDEIVLCGHLDKIVNFGGDFFVMDHKTTSVSPGAYFFDGYNPDNQMSLYSFAAQIILKSPVQGVIIDAAQVAVGFSAFSRGFTFRTRSQLDEWYENMQAYVKLAWHYADDEFFPMNDKACNNYGKCAFHKVCSTAPSMRETIIASDYIEQDWNPLIPR